MLPAFALAGAVVAVALAFALKPAPAVVQSSVIAGGLTPTSALASPSADAARARDERRGADAYAIVGASYRYYYDHQSYPSAPAVQPLCIDPSVDAGCRFESYLGQIPFDPRGDPAANGYWYQSDGMSYTLYMSMEVGGAMDGADCGSPIPPQLSGVPHLFCVKMGSPKS